MNPALAGVWKKPSRFKVLHGGRASSKTWDAAANAIRIARHVRIRFLCTRMFQNRIEESVYNVLKVQAERFGVAHEFDFQKTKIIHRQTGSEFLFYGIARNLSEIRGLEGIDILWIEEAHALTSEMFAVLEDTIRKDGSEIWVIFNPRLVSDFAYQRFVVDPPEGSIVRQINYTENIFCSQTTRDTAERLKKSNYKEYEHRYLGVPLNDDDRAIIKRTWVEASIDAHKALKIDPSGKHRVGFDVADDGDDRNATTSMHGQLCHRIEEWQGLENELLKSCSRVYQLAESLGAEIDYDCIGVGASAGSKFQELNIGKKRPVRFFKFNAGGKIIRPDSDWQPGVKNKDFFTNLKAQAWWIISERFRKTYMWVREGEKCNPSEIISISSKCNHLEKLITELSTPHKDFDPSGKVKVESKKDLIKRDVKSPNIADAFIMANAPRSQTYTLDNVS